jgi:2-hydroxychromene-2-carboxylate isomerase
MLKKIIGLSFLLFVSNTIQAGPLERYLTNRETFTNNWQQLEKVLKAQIIKLEAIASKRGSTATLRPSEVGTLVAAVSRAAQLASHPALEMRYVTADFKIVALHQPPYDRAGSIEVVMQSIDQNLSVLVSEAAANGSIEHSLGVLKAAYFQMMDVAGYLLISIGEAASLSRVSMNDAIAQGQSIQEYSAQLSALCLPLLELFELSSKYLLSATSTVGERSIGYLSGSTFGHISEVGPSPLTGADALTEEKRLTAELVLQVNALKAGYLKFLQAGSNCPGGLGKAAAAKPKKRK